MSYLIFLSLSTALVIATMSLIRYRQTWRTLYRFYQEHPEPQVRINLISGEILDCNEKFAQCRGYATTQDCLLNNHIDNHLPDLDLQAISNLGITSSDLPFEFETTRSVRLDGVKQLYSVYIVSIVSGKQVDISLRPIATSQISANFRTLVQITLTPSLSIRGFNSAAISLFGERLQKGRSVTSLIQTDLQRRILKIIRARTRHGNFSVPVLSVIAENRCERMIWHFSAQDSDEIQLACVRQPAVLPDQRQQADILDEPSGTWVFDSVHKTLHQSRRWIEIIGYDHHSTGSGVEFWLQCVHPNDLPVIQNEYRKLMKGEVDHLRLQYSFARADGKEVVVQTTGQVTQRLADGSPGKIGGFHRIMNESERKRLKLKETVHDLANHFTSIKGYTKLILDDSDSQIAGYAEQIQTGVERAQQIISAEWGYAKNHPHSVYELVNKVCDDLGIYSTVHMNRERSFEPPAQLLEKALLVLIRNSIAAGSGPDGVRVRTDLGDFSECQCSSCGCDIAGEHFQISVTDEGGGIPRERQAFIFERGFSTRCVNSRKENELYLLDREMHELMGHVTLNSSRRGTRVSLYLPVARVENMLESPTAFFRILVIDDEPAVCAYISEVLQRQGYEVTTMNDPIKAVRRFSRNPNYFDLIISDQRMQDLPGELIVQKVHQIRPELPIIICSGYSQGVSEGLVQTSGASGFIRKPIDADHLVGLVESRLQKVSQT